MKFSKIPLLLPLLFICIAGSCKKEVKDKEIQTQEVNWSQAEKYYLDAITKSINLMDSLAKLPVNSALAVGVFKKAREEFKKAEPYASYLNPPVGHRANGPALPVFLEDTERILPPIGLQKVEERIFEEGADQALFTREVKLTRGLLANLQHNISQRELTPQRFFIATHQQLLRIISLSIVGFDTPTSYWGLEESKVSLKSLMEVYSYSIRPVILKKAPELDKLFLKHIEAASAFIDLNSNFETFDRFTFIRDYMNPITRDWVEIRKASQLWEGVNNKPFNFDAPTFFETNSFNLDYFKPVTHRNATQVQIALGEKLFFDADLSNDGAMSCATCHNPEKAYADGMIFNVGNDGQPLQRNTPTLINTAYQQSFFWDGRSETLRDQITSVFTNEKEFNTSVHEFNVEILEDPEYQQLFEEAFGGTVRKNTEVIRAISSYIATLYGFNSKFDRNIRGEENTFTEVEKQGFNLYMGKALCATCHFMPLTNGTVPPFFAETEKEVIGVPETAANLELDDDPGFYWRWGKDIHYGMFKTPTVRNAELTAPYMHNGVYNTLEEVMDFYNRGGGGGFGFDLEHQTLPFDQLNLSDHEQKALVAFVKTLTDTEIDDN